MDERRREIARRYLLPERPFLHGMASAFDMFGVLDGGRLERLRRRDLFRRRESDADALRMLWQEVGDTILLAIDHYEREPRAGDSA